MKRSRAAIGTAALTGAVTSLALLAGAPASTAAVSETITTGLVGPLQFDVEATGAESRIVVAQSFRGVLTEVHPDGRKRKLYTQENGEVAGVAIEGDTVAFLTSRFTRKPASFLKVLDGDGNVDAVANLWRYEEETNPDQDLKYGFAKLSKNCKSKLPKGAGLRPYTGIVESHPYGLADAPDGGWYVADAAGNDILHVSEDGTVRTVAVLPAQRTVVTKAAAEANDLPKCTVGKTFRFEAVPTDVEVDDAGQLVVSLLPGGPEDPSLGARGSVHRIDPATGETTMLADGFAAATNVAIGGSSIFVAELFGGQVTEIDGDMRRVFSKANTPAAVEWADGKLYALIKVFNQKKGGSLVVLTGPSD